MAGDAFNPGNGSKDTTNDPGSNIAIGQIVLGAVVGIVLGVLASHFVHPPPPTPQAQAARQRVTHYHYAENGMKDEEWEYKEGRLVCHKRDRALRGAYDYWAYYDAQANVTRVEEDNNLDGKPDQFWMYSNNAVVSMERDNDFNGMPDEFLTYKARFPVQLDIKPNGSTFTTVREVFSNGILTEIWRGGDSNGNFREVISYDPMFNPIKTNVPFHPLLSAPEH